MALAIAATLAAPAATFSPSAIAQEAKTTQELTQQVDFSIPAGPLSTALGRFADQANILLSADSTLTDGKQTSGVRGAMPTAQALNQLLSGTGLSYRVTGSDSITITRSNDVEGEGTETLAPIMVSGWRTSTTDDYRASLVSSATKTQEQLVDVPGTVSVVTERAIRDQNATTVTEALRNVPGIGVGPNPANVSVQEEVSIRGFESALIRVNGVQRRSTGPMSTANISSVEVLKGPFSVLYGDLSPGGFVNVQTKRPQAEAARSVSVSSSKVTGSSGHSFDGSIDLTGPLNDDRSLLYRFIASGEDGDSFVSDNDRQQVFFAPSLSYLTEDERLRVDLDLTYLSNDETFEFGVPTRNNRPDDRIDYSAFLGSKDSSKETKDYSAEVRAEYALSDLTKVDAALTWHLNEHDSRALRPFGGPGQQVAGDDTVRRSYSLRVFDSEDKQFETNLIHEVLTENVEWRFLAGADIRETTVKDAGPGRANIANFDRVNVLDPDNSSALPSLNDPRLTFFPESNQTTESWGAYVQAEAWIQDRVKLIAGARYTDIEYTYEDADPFLFVEQADKVSPRAGILFKVTPTTSLYGSYSTSFEQPLSFDPANPADPTEAEQWEAGVKQGFMNGRLYATASVFKIVQENIPQPDPNDPNSTIQIGEAETSGMEFELNGSLTEQLDIIAGYAYLKNQVSDATDGTEGNRLPSTPRHSGSIWLNYQVFDQGVRGLTIGAGLFAKGERFTSVQNQNTMPGYATVDANAQYRFRYADSNVTVQAGLKNVFDREYYTGGFGEGIAFRGEPRTAYLKLTTDF
ncbi:TonB-dependent siderophore receptor [Marinobacter sp. NSM]|uniref:TonB-dependent siderophore receptor n=1 Tax=Marinobacter sp. NSM TaxID=3458004 RepID=UPI004035320A